MSKVLSLDLGTNCTGYAIFSVENKKLLKYGILKPEKIKGLAKMKYPQKPLEKMRNLAEQINELIALEKPTILVVEEICKGKSRLGQKTLDGYHFIVLDRLSEDYLKRVSYCEVITWRQKLNIRLSPRDKLFNADARKLNKRLTKAQQKYIITAKHIACRFVNKQFGLELDVEERKTDSDIADSICVGWSYLISIGG